MVMGGGILGTKEQMYIVSKLRNYRIVGRLFGGSSAELFILEKVVSTEERKYVIKICAKEGVDNGKNKLIGEIEYLNEAIITSLGMFVEVIDFYYDSDIAWYIMPYYKDKISIHKMICENIECKDVISRIFGDMFSFVYLQNIKGAKQDFTIKRNICRVRARMQECERLDKIFYDMSQYGEVIVNGKKLHGYNVIMNKIVSNPRLLQHISPIVSSLTHDDLTIENVIVGENKYIIIDPRGIADTGEYRDYIYDIAKFTLTLSGFTTIKYNMFNVDQHKNVITYKLNENLQNKYDMYYSYVLEVSKTLIEKFFAEDIYWKERLLFSEGCHYLADIACRMYNGDEFEKLIALYARGLEVLNSFYEKVQMP